MTLAATSIGLTAIYNHESSSILQKGSLAPLDLDDTVSPKEGAAVPVSTDPKVSTPLQEQNQNQGKGQPNSLGKESSPSEVKKSSPSQEQ